MLKITLRRIACAAAVLAMLLAAVPAEQVSAAMRVSQGTWMVISHDSAGSGASLGKAVETSDPEITTVVSGSGYILLRWDPVMGAKKYTIRKTTAYGTSYITQRGHRRTYYTDHDLVPGQKVTYSLGCGGEWSEEKTAVFRPGTPMIRRYTRRTIAWEPVRGVYQYEVIRRVKGRWRRVCFTSSLYYRSQDVARHRYSVRAVTAGGIRSGFDRTFRRFGKKYRKMKLVIEGDSFCAIEPSFARRTAFELGCMTANRAVNGSTMTSGRNSIYDRAMKQGFKGADAVLICAGTNDYGFGCPAGSWDSTDENTFTGAYRKVLERLRKDAPDAVVILCTPAERGEIYKRPVASGYDTKNRDGSTLSDYRHRILKLAKEYDCTVFDMARSGVVTETNYNTSTVDYLHMNANANIRMSDMLTERLTGALFL
ncbi:MAG: GDSL-type esterase/lipase family protein [Anaerovoracaceae bacterium]